MDSLPAFTSAKPCPRCGELLHWSEKNPPQVHYNTRSGFVSHVDLWRFCPACDYQEVGFVNIDRDPVWTRIELQ